MASPRASETLMGVMRELIGQSERVARAEARVAASRLRDVAQSGAKRGALFALSAVFGGTAMLYLLFAAFLSLARVMPGWQAALILAGSCVVIALGLAWVASRVAIADAVGDSDHMNTSREVHKWE
jgi:cytochrome c biogenesis protein CcdA